MSERIQTVLVGTSLDEASDGVARVAAEIARAAGAEVHLVHAFAPPLGLGSEFGPSFLHEEALGAQEELARQLLEEQAGRLGAASSFAAGAPHRVLPELAAQLGAGLLVVGAAAGPMARLLGSTADRVLRKAPCPVLVVRAGLSVPPARVLAPVDLSPLSAEAFRRGIGLLRAFGGGVVPGVEALFVLSVVQRQVSPQFTPEQVDRFAAEELERFVAAHGEGADVRPKVRTGNAREEILAEIRESGADLVLIGTHGLGGFDRLVIGSVAADVAREAPASVLVISPGERS